MRTSKILLPLLLLSSLLLLTHSTVSDDDEDLSFLDEPTTDSLPSGSDPDTDWADSDDVPDIESAEYDDEDDPYSLPAVDEKDVVVLTEANFSSFVAKTKHAMVEFYAPWCGHCQALAPEYAAAATELREEKVDVVLAKVDATEDEELSGKFEVQGFPTVLFFIDGVHKPYNGQRTKDAIVTWIKKKIGPGIQNITTLDEAETILTTQTKLALAFLEDLVGPDSEELVSASKLEDDVNFYQTVNPEVAKLFHIDTNSKRPSLVMLKKENEKISYFDGQFQKTAIAEFVAANKIPLVTYFTRESAPLVFENSIKNQVLLFATSNQSKKVLPFFEEAAKSFKGKLIFVYVERDNKDVGVPVSEYFGITGDEPKILGYTGNEDGKKYIFDRELTLENIKVFADDLLQDKLKPFYKSDPIPETNDGDVKIVVGNNFDDIVLDESTDVLLEIHAPWCGHCQALEPIYNKLAKHLNGIDSLIIAKMDGTTNEHPRAKADGFPTLLFFPAGNKSFEPVTVETERTVVELYKFIKKHAAIPFKLQKPASEAKPEATPSVESNLKGTDTSDKLKDEL